MHGLPAPQEVCRHHIAAGGLIACRCISSVNCCRLSSSLVVHCLPVQGCLHTRSHLNIQIISAQQRCVFQSAVFHSVHRLQPGTVSPCLSTTRASSRTEAQQEQRQQHPGAGKMLGPADSPRAGAGKALLQQQQQQLPVLLGSCLLLSGTNRAAVVGGAARAGRAAAGRARQAQVAAATAAAGRGRAGVPWEAKRWVSMQRSWSF
jgi:hypothetical protein